MHTLLLLLIFIFSCRAPQQQLAAITTQTKTNSNRRILHEPFVPLNTLPPSEAPKPSPPSTQKPKHPYSTTTTTTTTTDESPPFFPNYPSPPPPPSLSNFASFPANISSLILPHSPTPTPSSSKLLPLALSAVALALLAVAVSAFLYFRRRRRNRHSGSAGHKDVRPDGGSQLFPRNAETAAKLRHAPSAASSEFLYLGTVVDSRRIEGSDDGGVDVNGGDLVSRKMESPELRPLPPLARQVLAPPPVTEAEAKEEEEEEEEFFSPRGSSLGGRESSGGTGSGSRRALSAVAGENFTERIDELSTSSLSSSNCGSPERSQSISLSPPASSSPLRTQPTTPETTPTPPPPQPQIATPVLSPALSPIHKQHVPSSCSSYSSSLYSSSCSTPERAFVHEEDTNTVATHSPSLSPLSLPPNLEKTTLHEDDEASVNLDTDHHACAPSSPPPPQERVLETNEAASTSALASPRVSNASSGSRKFLPSSPSSSTSAFSLPSSPEKAASHIGFDQSPRMSSVSDRFRQPDLSSLPLSPTLLSSPEIERGLNGTLNPSESEAVANGVSQRKHWEIPVLSTTTATPLGTVVGNVLDQIGNVPVTHPPPPPPPPPPPVSQRKQWEIPALSTPIAPSSAVPPPPPPPAPLLQRQRKQWEVPAPTTPVGQPVSRPPELIPPSRPFVLQTPATKVSPVELPPSSQSLVAAEEAAKPKLKPLHWDKVRASSDREMVWDQLKSSSFKLNEEMIETLFVVNTPNPKPRDATPRSVLPPPSQEERVLDPKKSQNIAILLRALNVTIEEVCEALLEGSVDTLGAELLECLLKMAPSKEEERKLKEHKEDSPTKLGPAEKFLKAVLDVPYAFKRVEAMLYMVNFDSEVEYLRKSFQTLEAACEELRSSRMFLKLLEAVLKTGNRMNVGTNRGDAQAFKLDTLLKLADVKGADGKTTLLHFVVQEIIRTEGARLSGTNQIPNSTLSEDVICRRLGLQVVSSLSSDLASVKKAAAMDSEVLSSDASKLSKGIANIAEVVQLNEMAGSDESSQKFTESMNKFIRMAEEEILKIQAQGSVALSLVKEITEYFHGDLAKEEAHPFRIFMVVRDFLAVLDGVCKEVGMINERTMVSSAHKFPVPVNPMLPQPLPGLHDRRHQNDSSDDDAPSP